MTKITLAAAAALILAATAASALGSRDESRGRPLVAMGSGRSATETRAVGGFRGVSLEGSGRVLLAIGPTLEVSVSGDDNLLPLVMTEVSGSTLRLGFVPGSAVRTVAPLVFRITVPAIEDLAVRGSGDIEAQGTIRADRLALSIGGSGSIRAAADTGEISARIDGSGSIDMEGRTGSQQVRINGSGDYRARGLESAAARVEVHGSGNANLFVRRELTVEIAGSGDVTYRGGAAVTVRDSGSGSVRAE
jgi:hypothetical protein